MIQISAVITGRYSKRRTVQGANGKRVTLITFKTQYAPILTGLAYSFILKQLWKTATRLFSDDSVDPRVGRGIAAIFKVLSVQECQKFQLILSERLGAQGLFEYNQISKQHVRLLFIS
jgi:hypothetical protein